MSEVTHSKPGVTGYRKYRCRCPECCAAGAVHLARERERGAKLRAEARAIRGPRPRPLPPIEELDWAILDAVRPGAGVRRRKPKTLSEADPGLVD